MRKKIYINSLISNKQFWKVRKFWTYFEIENEIYQKSKTQMKICIPYNIQRILYYCKVVIYARGQVCDVYSQTLRMGVKYATECCVVKNLRDRQNWNHVRVTPLQKYADIMYELPPFKIVSIWNVQVRMNKYWLRIEN